MGAVGAGVAVAGTLMQVYGMVSGAQKQAEAQRKQSELGKAQADELLAREAINEQIIRDKSENDQSNFVARVGSTGVSGGVGGILRMRQNTDQLLANSRRDANYKAMMIRAGADMQGNLASDSITAGYIGGGGTLLTGLSNTFYHPETGPSATPDANTGKKKGLYN